MLCKAMSHPSRGADGGAAKKERRFDKRREDEVKGTKKKFGEVKGLAAPCRMGWMGAGAAGKFRAQHFSAAWWGGRHKKELGVSLLTTI